MSLTILVVVDKSFWTSVSRSSKSGQDGQVEHLVTLLILHALCYLLLVSRVSSTRELC